MKNSVLKLMKLDCENVSKMIEDFILSSVRHFKRDGVIIGLSGGLDSSVAAALSFRALGREKVFALIMPDRDSEPDNIKDAVYLAKSLKIKYELLEISPILEKVGVYNLVPQDIKKDKDSLMKQFKNLRRSSTFGAHTVSLPIFRKRSSLAYVYSIPKLRIRSILLFYNACLRNLLVVGTINKSEYLTGFYDKYGDGACEIAPLQSLYKTQIRQLAQYLGLPKRIIVKPPSPDVFLGSIFTDEFIIGMSFDQLDSILCCLEIGIKSGEISKELDVEEVVVKEVEKAIATADFKRQMPITFNISQNTTNLDLSSLEKIVDV